MYHILNKHAHPPVDCGYHVPVLLEPAQLVEVCVPKTTILVGILALF